VVSAKVVRAFCFSSVFSFNGSVVTFEDVFDWAAKNSIDVLILSDTTLCGIGNFILHARRFPKLRALVGMRFPDEPNKTFLATNDEQLELIINSYNSGRFSQIKNLPYVDIPPAQYLPDQQQLWSIFRDKLEKFRGQQVTYNPISNEPRIFEIQELSFHQDLINSLQRFTGYELAPGQKLPVAPEGFLERFAGFASERNQRERMLKEIKLIRSKGFEDYFYTIYKIVSIARENGILLGPGRGSAVGSYLLYLMGVTSINPLEFGLLFERFLNEGRQDYPDVDIDVEDERRQELIELLRKEFGYVYHISAYSTLPAKFMEDLPMSLTEKLRSIPVSRTTHAAGLVISTTPLRLPIAPGTQTLEWDMETLEKWGLVKIDILGLKTLSVYKELTSRIEIETIPLNDRKTFKYVSTGFTDNIFQLDSKLGKMVVRDVKPSSIRELAMAISLNRPGPIKAGIIDRIKKAKKEKRKLFNFDILDETFGFPLYQEQVMLIALQLAGMTPVEADSLRRAISKGDASSFKELYERLERILTLKFGKTGKELAKSILAFGEYTFNKSHAIAYAHLTYFMAYFKTNHPTLFYSVYLKHDSSVLEDALYNLQVLGYKVLPPIVKFKGVSTERDKLTETIFQLPFSVVPGISIAKAEELENRVFETFEEFVDSSGLNISTIEALIKVGSFDAIFESRRKAIQKLRHLRTGLNPEAQRLARLFGKKTAEPETKIEEIWERTLMEFETIGIGLTPPAECENLLAPYCLAYALNLPYAVHVRVKAGFGTDGRSVFKVNAPDGVYTLVYPSKLHEGLRRVIYIVDEISQSEISKSKVVGGFEKVVVEDVNNTTIIENARPIVNRFQTQILD